VIVTVHAPVPEQSPLQPVKAECASGVAVSVTTVAPSNVAEHVDPQSMPDGLLLTLPTPVPLRATVSTNRCSVNVALTLFAASIVTEHEPVPEHVPPQPVNFEPGSAAALRATVVSCPNGASHVEGQSIPSGLLVTFAWPVVVTWSGNVRSTN